MIHSAANRGWRPGAQQGVKGGLSSGAESILHLSLLNSAPPSNKSSGAGVEGLVSLKRAFGSSISIANAGGLWESDCY